MRIVDFLNEALIIPYLQSRGKDDVIRELGAFLAGHHPGVSEWDASRALAERELAGSTALAGGVAVPHAKLRSTRELVACLGRSRHGIDFGSPDGKSTHFFFALIAPERAQGEHLKALARISKVFGNEDFRARLLAVKTARELYEIIAAEEAE